MSKNLVIVFLAGATVVLALTLTTLLLRRPMAPVEFTNDGARGASTSVNAGGPEIQPAMAVEGAAFDRGAERFDALTTENERLREEVRNLRSEVSVLNARRMPAPSVREGGANLPQIPQQILSRLLGDPATVDLAMDWIRADQANRFASLIALAGLDAPAEARLRDLLAERYATRLDVAAAGLESVSPEQRGQLDAEFRSRLEAIVGADLAALFEKAEGKPISFARMQRFDERLRYQAEPLDRSQYLPLWELMSSQVFYSQPMRTEEDFHALLQRRTDAAAAIAAGARALLTSDQLRTLSAMLDDDLALARIQTQLAVEQLRARQDRETNAAPAGASPSP